MVVIYLNLPDPDCPPPIPPPRPPHGDGAAPDQHRPPGDGPWGPPGLPGGPAAPGRVLHGPAGRPVHAGGLRAHRGAGAGLWQAAGGGCLTPRPDGFGLGPRNTQKQLY